MKYLAVALLLLLTANCAISHLSDEKLDEGVRTRASFDMDCSKKNLDLTILSRSGGGYINAFGVEGCGKKAVYLRELDNTNWTLNSGDREAETKN